MKFQKGSRRSPIVYEKDLVKYWKERQIFEKSVEMRPESNAYVFYDGPPFITGTPHHGQLLGSTVKDSVARYWTMKGKRVERVWGWDCHGLPAEVFTEKKLGIKDKRDIGIKISLEEYIKTCRDNMIQTGALWEDTIDRIGRWVDFKNAYKTMDKDYMESVWWAFKRLYEMGKIYEGEKVLLYCTRDATPISKAEVAMDNSYMDVTDPSVYVKFKLKDSDEYLLAWTTTPWTLPANSAVAINADEEYATVELERQNLILAKTLLDKVLTDEKHNVVTYTIKRTFKGKELIGKEYEPLFEDRGKNAHKVWQADYVHLEEGTGIVHLAPAYGEEDYYLAKEKDFPVIANIDDNGFYTSGEWKGEQVWDTNKAIAKALQERGVVWKIEYVRHSYPHCHRCGTRLMYRAHPSWFMKIDQQRTQMLEANSDINWFPTHIKEGRFAHTVLSAPDWNLSRDRFWATAMPVWKGVGKDGKEYIKVVGSYAELKELSGVELDDYHRPWVDDVTFELDGVTYKRIDKVMDCWFESGSMPFAQFHYPFENREKFEQNFPGDFIAEYVGQVRAWFYYLHALSVGLFENRAFNNVIVTGTLAGNDGRKMSKSYGNYTNPNILMDEYSADALRFLLLSSPVLNAEDFSLVDKDVGDVARKLNMIWNMYDFFTLYAFVDKWEWDGSMEDPSPELSNSLDQWIVSRVHQLNREIEEHLSHYDLPNATKPITAFIEDASNWYVRRSRRRFWKSEDDTDKKNAYRTLHYVLVQLALVMAPFTPFLSEELFIKLTGYESVHLRDWPPAGHINELLVSDMTFVREVINEGLSQRASAHLKARQPLSSVNIYDQHNRLTEEYKEIIAEELNVKEVHTRRNQRIKSDSSFLKSYLERLSAHPAAVLDVNVTPELRREGYMREIVRHVQNTRKQADLSVEDRIDLSLDSSSGDIQAAIKKYTDVICHETLSVSLNERETKGFIANVQVDGKDLTIGISKKEA